MIKYAQFSLLVVYWFTVDQENVCSEHVLCSCSYLITVMHALHPRSFVLFSLNESTLAVAIELRGMSRYWLVNQEHMLGKSPSHITKLC